MVRNYHFFVVVCCVFMLAATGVDAGDRRHQQSACDGADLVGAAYGACHRYCDALDCEAPNPHGNAQSCEQALDRFFDLTGNFPPCMSACPCAPAWRDEGFIPGGEVNGECFVQISDFGAQIDVALEGGPDENGLYPSSFAGTGFFSSEEQAFHNVGCYSDHFDDAGAPLSDDSGSYEMVNNFREPTRRFLNDQRRQFRACQQMLKRILRRADVECVVNDERTE
jgi:hypothetical protein